MQINVWVWIVIGRWSSGQSEFGGLRNNGRRIYRVRRDLQATNSTQTT
jgi:hypothetical protein